MKIGVMVQRILRRRSSNIKRGNWICNQKCTKFQIRCPAKTPTELIKMLDESITVLLDLLKTVYTTIRNINTKTMCSTHI